MFGRSSSSSTPPPAPPAPSSSAPFTPAPTSSSMQAQKEALMDQVRQETALSNAQALIDKIQDKCYARCITKPSTSLGSSDEACLGRCMDRYMEAFNIVTRTYVERLARERQAEATRFQQE